MYHHFHAPHDLTVEQVCYIPGDCWNVNPPALARVDRLYCRNERAVIGCRLADGSKLTLVAVAAILVAGIRLRCVEGGLRPLDGSHVRLSALAAKGVELGWFEHGSTLVMLVPPGWHPLDWISEGYRIRMGQALFARDQPLLRFRRL